MSTIPSINSLLSNSKAESSVSPITIGTFPSSARLLTSSATPITQTQESPDSLCSGTSSLLLNNEIDPVFDNLTPRFSHQRRSLSENSLGLLRESALSTSPFKSPSALEAMQAVAKTHLKPDPVPDSSSFPTKPAHVSSPFKLSSFFWNSDILGPTTPDASAPTRSILFSGWKTSASSKPNAPEGKVFKLPLQVATFNTRINRGIPLPAVVVRCVEYLDNEGLNEVGLYRIPGATSLVSQLKARYDSGEDFDLNTDPKPDPHAVATLLKLYIRELPESILTPRVLTEVNHFLVNTKSTENSNQPSVPVHLDNRVLYQAEQIRLLVRNIPDPNYYLLHWLTRHLARVDCNKAINKMDISNLGMIFCPTMGISSLLFRIFVIHSETIFPLPKPPGDATLKRPSPRPYSYSSTRSTTPAPSKEASINSIASFLKLKNSMVSPLSKNSDTSSPDDLREAQNVALFENLKAIQEAQQLASHKNPPVWDQESKMSSMRSRNSIISYQTTKSQRSFSNDSTLAPLSSSGITEEVVEPPEMSFISSNPSRPKAQRRRNTDSGETPSFNKLHSPGLTQLDYFDGTSVSHALLNLKTRRINPGVVRLPLPKVSNSSLASTSSKPPESKQDHSDTHRGPPDDNKPGWSVLAGVDLSKSRANLRPISRNDPV